MTTLGVLSIVAVAAVVGIIVTTGGTQVSAQDAPVYTLSSPIARTSEPARVSPAPADCAPLLPRGDAGAARWSTAAHVIPLPVSDRFSGRAQSSLC